MELPRYEFVIEQPVFGAGNGGIDDQPAAQRGAGLTLVGSLGTIDETALWGMEDSSAFTV